MITQERLRWSKPENVIRLAKWLKIDTRGLTIESVITKVYFKCMCM